MSGPVRADACASLLRQQRKNPGTFFRSARGIFQHDNRFPAYFFFRRAGMITASVHTHRPVSISSSHRSGWAVSPVLGGGLGVGVGVGVIVEVGVGPGSGE